MPTADQTKSFDGRKLFKLALALAVIYAALRWFLFILLPLGLGWILSHYIQRPAAFLGSRLRIKKNICSAALVALSLLAALAAAALALTKLAGEARGVFTSLAGAAQGAVGLAADAAASIDRLIGSDLETRIPQILGDLVARAAESAPGIIAGIVSSLPFILIGAVVFIMSSFSFCGDFHGMNRKVLSFFDQKIARFLAELKDQFLITAANYLKAYMCLFVISFTQLYFALTVLRAPYAFSAAFLIALCDVLPLLGMGVVVIPWMIVSFFSGSAAFGAGLAVTFCVMTVTRQIAEPKVVGSFIGLHPLASLICVCVGLRAMGVIGVFLFPVLATILINLKRSGRFSLRDSSEEKTI